MPLGWTRRLWSLLGFLLLQRACIYGLVLNFPQSPQVQQGTDIVVHWDVDQDSDPDTFRLQFVESDPTPEYVVATQIVERDGQDSGDVTFQVGMLEPGHYIAIAWTNEDVDAQGLNNTDMLEIVPQVSSRFNPLVVILPVVFGVVFILVAIISIIIFRRRKARSLMTSPAVSKEPQSREVVTRRRGTLQRSYRPHLVPRWGSDEKAPVVILKSEPTSLVSEYPSVSTPSETDIYSSSAPPAYHPSVDDDVPTEDQTESHR